MVSVHTSASSPATGGATPALALAAEGETEEVAGYRAIGGLESGVNALHERFDHRR